MSGGNVILITPSQAGYKASKVDWGSGGGSPTVHLPTAKLLKNLDYYLHYLVQDQDGVPIANAKCLLLNLMVQQKYIIQI